MSWKQLQEDASQKMQSDTQENIETEEPEAEHKQNQILRRWPRESAKEESSTLRKSGQYQSILRQHLT